MDLSKIIIICAFYNVLGVGFVFSLPTFGTEHVHIKVHLAPRHAITTDALNSLCQDVKHKIIHHYHHHQKAPRKEIVPVLENFYLSELDKPHSHDHLHQHKQKPKYYEETFLVKTQSNNPKPKKNHAEYAESPVETIRLIESKPHHDIEYKLQHQENTDHHIATVNVVDDSSLHLEDAMKVIEAPKFTTPARAQGHEPQVNEVVDEGPQIESSLTGGAKNHNYDIKYDSVSPEKAQSFHFQEVPIFQEIPNTPHSGPTSAVITEELLKYSKPFQATSDYLQQETQSTKLASIGEGQDSLKYVTDYQKYLPSSENPQSFNGPQLNFQHSVDIDSNTKDIHEANQKAAETYTGHDSYSAAHVQGLGSGGYSYHKPL